MAYSANIINLSANRLKTAQKLCGALIKLMAHEFGYKIMAFEPSFNSRNFSIAEEIILAIENT